uniref:Uncharacterized protein n=1 Tax=Cannabis sativa TaxID=3483 RepID=A0A803R3P7_CANSA
MNGQISLLLQIMLWPKTKNNEQIMYIIILFWFFVFCFQRMDSYYKRNYKDYFELVEGTMRGKDGEISEAEKGILEWLQKNK